MAKNRKFLLLLFFISAFLNVSGFAYLPVDTVYALETSYPSILGVSVNDTSTFPEYARYFFTFGISISITLAALVIIFGGIYYLISLGRGKFTDEGKEWIKAGVLGLFLILGAYLIVYTINPDLTVFRLDNLDQINFNPLNPNTPTPGQKTTTYNEIPIGSSVEKLLTKQIGCYAFDENGDPIKGEKMEALPCQDDICHSVAPNAQPEQIDAPTFLKNDRVECAINLEAGIKAKLKQIKEQIIDPLIDLMNNNCNCTGDIPEADRADSVFNKNFYGASLLAANDANSEDPTKCDASCNIENGCDEYRGECAENTIITNENCSGDCKEKGCKPKNSSDKLCCQNPDNTKKTIENTLKLLESDPSHQNYTSNLTKSYVYDNDDGYISVINIENWKKLNLGEQFYFLTEKLNSLQQGVENDSQLLANQASQLNKCYFAVTAVDLANLIKQTNQSENLIMVNGEQLSKYCKAFNYSNSSCYKKCQDMCPDNQGVTSCVSNCPNCASDDSDCLKKQTKCMGGCLDKKTCPNSPFGNLGECMNSCSDQCLENCQKIYSENSDELNICQTQCQSNSKCLAENVPACIFSQSGPDKCADTIQNNDAENLDYCINRSYYSCKYGSYQNAGYVDCANGYGCAKTNGAYPPFLKSSLFSSSYLFQNPEKERCQNSFQQCFTDKNVRKTCKEVYPETAKCPTLSSCPYCPCTSLEDKTLKFTPLPQKTGRCEDDNNNNSFTITGYQIVGPECGEYSFSSDPLTFYCQQDWWNNDKEKRETPMGKERFCPKNSEIPVGQTIDDAQKWASEFMQKIDDFKKVIQKEVADPLAVIQKHIEDKDYCKCDSKMNKDACCVGSCEKTPACFTDCKFVKTESAEEGGGYSCSCNFEPCSGQPCQQMIDLLTKISNAYNKLLEPYGKLFVFYIDDQRSEVLKELTYSREKTNNCSVTRNTYGTQAKLMSCGRIEDELIPPINTDMATIINGKAIQNYCYGNKLGKLFNTNLNDNWFCCEVYNPEQSESKSQ